MRETRELWLRFFKSSFSLMLICIGFICVFIFPKQGFNILGSSVLIAFSYGTTLYLQKGQLLEFVLLLGILAVTGYAYAYPDSLSGLLFVPQIFYLFVQLGRLFVFKVIKHTYKHFKRRWLKKSSRRN